MKIILNGWIGILILKIFYIEDFDISIHFYIEDFFFFRLLFFKNNKFTDNNLVQAENFCGQSSTILRKMDKQDRTGHRISYISVHIISSISDQ
jgi:hypothetical protein